MWLGKWDKSGIKKFWIGNLMKIWGIDVDLLWDGVISSKRSSDLSGKGQLKIAEGGGPAWGVFPKMGKGVVASSAAPVNTLLK